MTLLERGQMMRRAAIRVFCALIPLCAFDARPTQAEETIMVLDASRSMWGTIDKTTKHTMVYDAFTRAFKQHAANAPRLGLVTFGNRSPSDCSDISVQIRPGATDRSEFLSTVKRIRPWGLTPIADALKRAAGEFSNTTQPNRIVLVVDGLENCRGNPCATARELKAQSAGLTIDVVALDVAAKDHAGLACIATATDGIFLAASSQKDLNQASSTLLERIAAGTPDGTPAPPIAGTQTETLKPSLALLRGAVPLPRTHPLADVRRLAQVKPIQKPDPDAPVRLFAARIPPHATIPGIPPAPVVDLPAIAQSATDLQQIALNMADAVQPEPQVDLPSAERPAAPIQVAVAPSTAPILPTSTSTDAETPVATSEPETPAEAGPVAVNPEPDPPLSAASMKVAAVPTDTQLEPETSENLPDDPTLPDPPQTATPDQNAAPDDTPEQADPLQTAAIPAKGDTSRQSALPEGDVQTLPERPSTPDTSARTSPETDTQSTPSAKHKPEFDIRNQSTPERQGIQLRAKLTAQMRHISRPVEWAVFKVENVEEALWKQVSAVRAAEPTIQLPPGTYLVRAYYGYVTASKMIDVVKGRQTDATFVLNAGGLRILSHLVFVDTPNGSRATHFIYTGEADENGMRTLIAKSDIQGEIVRLNAGKYRVISRLGDANSVVSTDVEVNPGVLTAVEINHKAGVLTLKVDDSDGERSATIKPNMVVFDENGKLVARVRGDTATTILAPGRYTVSAERAGKTVTTDIDIRIGEDKSVNLDLE